MELSLLNTGRRASPASLLPAPLLHTEDVDEDEDSGPWGCWMPIIGVGLRSLGLGGGLGMIAEILVLLNGKVAPPDRGNAALSGKKFTIELVGLIDSDPVGLALSEPVDMLIAGLRVIE